MQSQKRGHKSAWFSSRGLGSIVAIMLTLLFAACSSQNTKWYNVQWHNLNCHYNVWWNGNESLKEGLKKLQTAAEDDYTTILPVYQLGTTEQALSVKSQMDRAIEKGIKGIHKHSIYVKGKEYVSYVKDCYLLTAYGSFYEKDFAATDNTCRLIMSQYAGTKEADEAMILLARSLTQQKLYFEAESALDELVNDVHEGNFTSSLTDKLYYAMVECCLPQEKYKKTVQYLRLAIDETSDSQMKARLYFIMAQIYQKLDKKQTASKYFNKVLSCHPTYVMEFNARINAAACTDMTRSDVDAVARQLDKMLRDKKNEEYRDQIYYAKGDMYLGVRDAQKACDNYRLSVASAGRNPQQKAKSALKMADVLYEIYENYDAAQLYYDTAMQIITVDYPHYDEIRERHYLLTSLVEFTRLIHLNDSLLTIADMDSAQRVAYVNQKIADYRKKEEEIKLQQMLADYAASSKTQTNTLKGDWYFYNSSTVDKGKDAFRKKWGMRPLEDNWFLSSRNTLAMGSGMLALDDASDSDDGAAQAGTETTTADSTNATTTVKDDPADPHCPAYYLKDVPTSIEARDSLHNQIAEALLNAAYIYYDGIDNTDHALRCYLRLANDYPETQNIEQAFYQLYRIYSKQGNTPSANYYRDMVLMGFPDSDFANLIRDDEYYKVIIKRSQQSQTAYAEVYSLYRRKRYPEVINKCRTAMEAYTDEPMHSKFGYWMALAYARTSNSDSAVYTLNTIIQSVADTFQIVSLAKEQLAYLTSLSSKEALADETVSPEDERQARSSRYGRQPARIGAADESNRGGNGSDNDLPVESQVYRYKEQQQHYVIIIINDKKIVATQLQYRISDFNMLNYVNAGYRVSPQMFTDTTQMLTIHRFLSASEAEKYVFHLMLDESPLKQYDPKDYTIFSISTQNYSTFYNRKNVDAYMAFYRKYYSSR